MLRVAKKRLQNGKRKAAPRKPKAPEYWGYDRGHMLNFFWSWLAVDCDPFKTPDGKSWQEQDQHFWDLAWYLKDLFDWAMHRAENPVMGIKPNMPSIADL